MFINIFRKLLYYPLTVKVIPREASPFAVAGRACPHRGGCCCSQVNAAENPYPQDRPAVGLAVTWLPSLFNTGAAAVSLI